MVWCSRVLSSTRVTYMYVMNRDRACFATCACIPWVCHDHEKDEDVEEDDVEWRPQRPVHGLQHDPPDHHVVGVGHGAVSHDEAGDAARILAEHVHLVTRDSVFSLVWCGIKPNPKPKGWMEWNGMEPGLVWSVVRDDDALDWRTDGRRGRIMG